MEELKDMVKIRFYHKLHFKIVFFLLFVFIVLCGANFFVGQKIYNDLEKSTIDISSQNVREVKKIAKANIIMVGEWIIASLAERIFFEQLAFLYSREELKGLNDPAKLIDYCIKSPEYQRIFDFKCKVNKYSYITVSIYNQNKLILVSHNKKDIVGSDIFELVKKLSPEDRKKQQTEKFISHWVNRESGGIYYEQTATFKDASIPDDYKTKYAYQHWGKFNGIDMVVEFTTYIKEFSAIADAVDKKHEDTINKISGCASESFKANFSFYVSVLTAIMLCLVFILLTLSKAFIIVPINCIISGLKRFGEGRLDSPINVVDKGELGVISEASNAMAQNLSATLQKLEKTNAGLEENIAERTAELEESRKMLKREKEKGETLIKNMLPEKIAFQLLENPEETIAKEHAMATIIFSDFKGFTSATEGTTPMKLVRELNEIFAYFDELCARFNIEKIKTIGDSYMAAGGLPESNETNPFDAVEMALAMRDYVERRLEDPKNLSLKIRIGVHSGPVIAGVIGKKRFIYDVWGDTVNIASRMESNGAPGKINISHETYKLVKERFDCEYRGEVEVKGKGLMKAYFVERRRG